MAIKMCKCKQCGVQMGVTSGLSAGGHVVGILLSLFTGFLFIPVYVLMMLCSGTTRCSSCGRHAKKL